MNLIRTGFRSPHRILRELVFEVTQYRMPFDSFDLDEEEEDNDNYEGATQHHPFTGLFYRGSLKGTSSCLRTCSIVH